MAVISDQYVAVAFDKHVDVISNKYVAYKFDTKLLTISILKPSYPIQNFGPVITALSHSKFCLGFVKWRTKG